MMNPISLPDANESLTTPTAGSESVAEGTTDNTSSADLPLIGQSGDMTDIAFYVIQSVLGIGGTLADGEHLELRVVMHCNRRDLFEEEPWPTCSF